MGFIECPHCGLKHTERATKLCPRCQGDVSVSTGGNELNVDAYRPPTRSQPAPSFSMGGDAPEEPGVTLGARIAGGVLILNALSFVYAGLALNVPASGRVSSLVVDLVLGIALLAGKTKVIPLCLVRVALGAVVFLGWSLYAGDYVSAALQIVLSGALLGLLLGSPSVLRVGVSAAAAAVYVVATGALLSFGTYVRNPDALLASREIEVIDQGSVQGLAFDYQLRVPSDDWFMRADTVTKQENPAADRWLVRPDRDAHFIIVAEPLGAPNVDVEAYQAAILRNVETAATRLEILETGPLWEHYGQSRRVRARALIQGLSIDYAFGIAVVQDVGYQFIGFASQTEYPHVDAEFQQMHQSIVIGTR